MPGNFKTTLDEQHEDYLKEKNAESLRREIPAARSNGLTHLEITTDQK
jgi:hypothetical protein